MADDERPQERSAETDAMLTRLHLIEEQPLDSRAASFTRIHDELQATLEGGDAPTRHG